MTNPTSLPKALVTLLVLGAYLVGCSKDIETSVGASRQHVSMLVETAARDVDELRKGMPDGAAYLSEVYGEKLAPKDDLAKVRVELERARNKIQDLRVAKSTFFALAETDGTVLRTDREPDAMSGKNLFGAFPMLREVSNGKQVEGRGNLVEAAAVRGRKDGQYVIAVPVVVKGEPRGIYVSGWSWSAYAYRLENALRSELQGKVKDIRDKVPLVYVFVVVDDAVYGAPVSPVINAESIRKVDPLKKTSGNSVLMMPMEITGREFGLAVRRAPSLGDKVAIAVLRSET